MMLLNMAISSKTKKERFTWDIKLSITLFLRIIMSLCEKGADYTLTNIEGNTPKDLADKNGHSKCSKYLGALVKGKLPHGTSENIVVSAKILRDVVMC